MSPEGTNNQVRAGEEEPQIRCLDISCCLCMDTVPSQHLIFRFLLLSRIIILVVWQTRWCFCVGTVSGNFGLPWRERADKASTGCSVSTASRMYGHSIATDSKFAGALHVPSTQNHLYSTHPWPSRNWGAAEEAFCHKCGHLCIQNLLGRNLTALNMDLPLSADISRLLCPC